tara:strand:+ start:16226 stop:17014 length:789 start_codon:yes stop_codon:yes gene_type:complete
MQVTVIINCFNSEKYLKQSIKSVLNQSYKNFELIIYDNNSTDKTEEIYKSFKDHRLRYFKTDQNYNLGKVRELALKESNYNWISFLDSDDEWLPDKLLEQVNYIQNKKNIGLVYSDFIYIDSNGLKLKKKSYTKFYTKKIFEELIKKNYICFSTIIFNKSIFKTKNIFNPILKNSEDLDLLLKISKNNTVGFVKNKLVKYRVHSENLTKFQTERSFSEWQYLMYKHSENYFKEKKNIKKKYLYELCKIKLLNRLKKLLNFIN